MTTNIFYIPGFYLENILGGVKLGLRAVLAAPGGGVGGGCALSRAKRGGYALFNHKQAENLIYTTLIMIMFELTMRMTASSYVGNMFMA